MSELPPILYFGNDWFADNRTSSHHVARQLARHTRLLYVEVPGLRAPRATSRDIRRVATKLMRTTRRVEADERLAVRTLPQLPLHGSAVARTVNAVVSGLYARAVSRLERMERPIVWCTIPHVASFVDRIPKSMLVYHCIDDYSALPGVDRDAIRALDADLSAQADLLVAASRPVYESKRRSRPDTLLMPHGVDVRHFARARSEALAEPPELQGVKRPIVGFIGLVEQWIDLELIASLAREFSDATFVIIGRVAVPAAMMPTERNVVFLGPKRYEDLPAYGRLFDAAIIPYKLTDQVIAANPLKLREYLAMGLPIVSVSTPEIDRFADVVAVASTREAFGAALRQALDTPPDAEAVARRMAFVQQGSWESRVDDLLVHVRRGLAGHDASSAA